VILASVLTTNLAILVLAGFVGFIVISKIPNTLHTPLMSGTNAIHGIVLVGALLLLGLPSVGLVKLDALSQALLVIAVMFGTINIVGGFLVTDRMLDMFKSRPKPQEQAPPAEASHAPAGAASPGATQAQAGGTIPPAAGDGASSQGGGEG
jgi:H+-translocating NAD(P) transhydrogenase subunit alpha